MSSVQGTTSSGTDRGPLSRLLGGSRNKMDVETTRVAGTPNGERIGEPEWKAGMERIQAYTPA